jgi:iodotyrosine deiodinase
MKAQIINGYPFIPYAIRQKQKDEMIRDSNNFFHWLDSRRSVRTFSATKFPFEIIENILRSASTAPSGAHKQPWTFCVVADHELKSRIRQAAEKEEYENYHGRMSQEWIDDLKPLQTDWSKEFLEVAPYLIVVFKKSYEKSEGARSLNYYVNESVGIACGFLLCAIHNAGLVALTHTPSPMNFLSTLLDRPANEKPFLLIPVGLPTDECLVPQLKRKDLADVSKFFL